MLQAKDQQDFDAAAPLLDTVAKAWLQESLATVHPKTMPSRRRQPAQFDRVHLMKTSEPLTPAEKASDGWARKLRPLLLPLLLPVVIVVVVAGAQSVDTLGLTLGSHFLECVGSVVLFLGGVAWPVRSRQPRPGNPTNSSCSRGHS